MDESSCQISAIVFALANAYGSHSPVFSRIQWMFFMFRSDTVCVKKYWLIRVIAEYYYVNLLIFLTVIGPLLCFYYALNILITLYRIGSWNATRTYSVQCWHDMKVSLFVRCENYTQVHRSGFSKGREGFLE